MPDLNFVSVCLFFIALLSNLGFTGLYGNREARAAFSANVLFIFFLIL